MSDTQPVAGMPRLAPNAGRRRTQDRFIDAAVEIFGRDGYRAARMEDVADRAGRSRTTLYTYFRGRPELVLAIRHRMKPESHEIFSKLGSLPERTPAAVRAWISEIADLFERRRVEFAISIEALSEPELHDSLQDDIADYVVVMQRAIAAARDDGAIPPLARVEIYFAQLIYTMHMVKVQQIFLDEDAVRDQLADMWWDIVTGPMEAS